VYAREEMLPAARFYSGDMEPKADFCPNYVQEYTLCPGSRFILLLTRLISHWTLPFISHMRASFTPNPHTPMAFCIFLLLRIFYGNKNDVPVVGFFRTKNLQIYLASNI
jgi:hypothetical protein